MDIIKQGLKNMPDDILVYIKEYLPLEVLVWLNSENYNTYHYVINKYIPKYEQYIRCIVRKDYDFVLKRVIYDNFSKWYAMKKYMYKHMVFDNYLRFLVEYANENHSSKSKYIIEDAVNLFLGKKRHKKTRVLFNRWRN